MIALHGTLLSAKLKQLHLPPRSPAAATPSHLWLRPLGQAAGLLGAVPPAPRLLPAGSAAGRAARLAPAALLAILQAGEVDGGQQKITQLIPPPCAALEAGQAAQQEPPRGSHPAEAPCTLRPEPPLSAAAASAAEFSSCAASSSAAKACSTPKKARGASMVERCPLMNPPSCLQGAGDGTAQHSIW